MDKRLNKLENSFTRKDYEAVRMSPEERELLERLLETIKDDIDLACIAEDDVSEETYKAKQESICAQFRAIVEELNILHERRAYFR